MKIVLNYKAPFAASGRLNHDVNGCGIVDDSGMSRMLIKGVMEGAAGLGLSRPTVAIGIGAGTSTTSRSGDDGRQLMQANGIKATAVFKQLQPWAFYRHAHQYPTVCASVQAIGIPAKPVSDVIVAQLFRRLRLRRPWFDSSPGIGVHRQGKPRLVIRRWQFRLRAGSTRWPTAQHACDNETISHSQRSVLPAPALYDGQPIDKPA